MFRELKHCLAQLKQEMDSPKEHVNIVNVKRNARNTKENQRQIIEWLKAEVTQQVVKTSEEDFLLALQDEFENHMGKACDKFVSIHYFFNLFQQGKIDETLSFNSVVRKELTKSCNKALEKCKSKNKNFILESLQGAIDRVYFEKAILFFISRENEYVGVDKFLVFIRENLDNLNSFFKEMVNVSMMQKDINQQMLHYQCSHYESRLINLINGVYTKLISMKVSCAANIMPSGDKNLNHEKLKNEVSILKKAVDENKIMQAFLQFDINEDLQTYFAPIAAENNFQLLIKQKSQYNYFQVIKIFENIQYQEGNNESKRKFKLALFHYVIKNFSRLSQSVNNEAVLAKLMVDMLHDVIPIFSWKLGVMNKQKIEWVTLIDFTKKEVRVPSHIATIFSLCSQAKSAVAKKLTANEQDELWCTYYNRIVMIFKKAQPNNNFPLWFKRIDFNRRDEKTQALYDICAQLPEFSITASTNALSEAGDIAYRKVSS